MTSSASSSDRRPALALLAVLGAVALQLAFWWHTRTLQPPADTLGAPPELAEVDFVSLSDRQAFFRINLLALQNAGDLNGRITPLAQMDYGRLVGWFELLGRLDVQSNAVLTLAGYFYGETTVARDVRAVAQYLRRAALRDPAARWRFLAHAIYLARYRAGDVPLALEMANDLARLDVPDLPVWTRQMRAFILADVGEREAARDVMQVILETDPNLSPEERNFIDHFLTQRLR